MVGKYPSLANPGGGYVWNEVMEYRVWRHPENGAPNLESENYYYYAFSTFEEALKFLKKTKVSEEPIALILQKEYVDEPKPKKYIHVKEGRITEWYIDFLT